MHSSGMRTGRALTVSGGGGGGGMCVCIPAGFFGGKRNWKKKFKKISDPPQNSDPPRKFQTRPPLLTESQTRVKILPWPNFVAAGNNLRGSNWIKNW